jgi:UDP-glucose 4-epimerase
LLGTLQVDISKARTLLGWQPKVSFHEGISRTLKE